MTCTSDLSKVCVNAELINAKTRIESIPANINAGADIMLYFECLVQCRHGAQDGYSACVKKLHL